MVKTVNVTYWNLRLDSQKSRFLTQGLRFRSFTWGIKPRSSSEDVRKVNQGKQTANARDASEQAPAVGNCCLSNFTDHDLQASPWRLGRLQHLLTSILHWLRLASRGINSSPTFWVMPESSWAMSSGDRESHHTEKKRGLGAWGGRLAAYWNRLL